MNLSQLKTGEKGIITKIKGRGAFRKRIAEMGFVRGKEVSVIKNAPLKNPIEYGILGYELSLRRSEAQLIEVLTPKEADNLNTNHFNGVITEERLATSARIKGKTINVALVGNPNSGKTTLFNYASRSREHVGNYSGVTIDSKKSRLKLNGYIFNIVDLPGTYSLSAYSPEELYVRKYIFGELPDIVVNIVDSSNLERNLYLTTQLIDMDIKVVMALNMYDELKQRGDQFDYKSLGKMIGIPIVPTVSSKGYGIKELFYRIIEVYEDTDPTVRHVHLNYGKIVEESIRRIQEEIRINESFTDLVSSRFYAIKLLEKDKSSHFSLSRWPNYAKIRETADSEIQKLERIYREDSDTLITDARYGFISGALKETFTGGESRQNTTTLIDAFMTNRFFGYPIFLLIMFIMFYTTFELGQFPMDWLNNGIGLFAGWLNEVLPSGAFKDLLVDGIIGGVGSVVIFLPNILILFFFISLMEDTGYMARAAFIMDKIMHKIGLHGRSFIPLLMGFGCNVPAIMATRTIENRNNRLLTILINPFMSCSARLPVYILIIGAFFPDRASLVLFTMYFVGIALAAIVAIVFKRLIFKTEEVPFVMELPPYRIPTILTTLRHMWQKGVQYLRKMGGVILVASILIWALGYYPRKITYSSNYDILIRNIENEYLEKSAMAGSYDPGQILSLEEEKEQLINDILLVKEAEKHEKSYIGKIGHFIEPALRPLGFDWRMGISLLSGIAAKEIVVSTIGILYQAGSDPDMNSETLSDKLKEQSFTNGKNKGAKVFNPVVAIAFLVFILTYFPCVAVIAAIRKETGSWKWALFTIFYTTALAWILAFLINQIGTIIFS